MRALLLIFAMCIAAPAGAADSDASKKSSPYAEANKRRVDQAAGKHQQSAKRVASGRAHTTPGRHKR